VQAPRRAQPRRRVIASNALEVKPLIGFGQALIAVFSALLGFLASVVTAWLARRGERKSTLQKVEAEIQAVLTRELAAEVVRNSLQLRGWLENAGSAPPDLKTWGGDLLFNPSRGALAYLSKPGRLGFLRKFTAVYDNSTATTAPWMRGSQAKPAPRPTLHSNSSTVRQS